MDNAIAAAVTEFSYRRDTILADRAAEATQERLACLAHEMRDLVHTATLALSVVRGGSVGWSGATGGVLARSIAGLRKLIDCTLAEARRRPPLPAQRRLISLADFIAEAGPIAVLEGEARNCEVAFSRVEPGLAIAVDRELLFSALSNLLENAFKFTAPHTEVAVTAYARRGSHSDRR